MTTPDAQKVLDALDRDAMVGLAQDLIRTPSYKTEETDAARLLGDYFRERGYEVEMQEVEPGRFQTIAVLRGTGDGKSLMLNGHIDIDPLAMGWKRDPWTPVVEDDRLYGAGVRNMKSGVAAMIEASEAIRLSGVRLRGDLVIACVAGELQGGVGTTYLCRHGPLADMGRGPRALRSKQHRHRQRRRRRDGRHTIGNSRHISRMEEAADAIEKMCKAVSAIKAVRFRHTPRPDLPGLPRVNVGTIIGGRGGTTTFADPTSSPTSAPSSSTPGSSPG